MKGVRNYFLLLMLLGLVTVCIGCGNDQTADSDYRIYYLDKDSTKIIERAYEPTANPKDTREMITEFLAQLKMDSGDVEYKKAIPNNVEITRYMLEGAVLTLYFDKDYNSMDKIEEALSRAAIVRTLTQIEGVECISFYVGDSPLADSKGKSGRKWFGTGGSGGTLQQ